jgi:hypothetical protein
MKRFSTFLGMFEEFAGHDQISEHTTTIPVPSGKKLISKSRISHLSGRKMLHHKRTSLD